MEPVTVAQFVSRIPTAFEEGDPEVSAKRLEAENVRLLHQLYSAVTRGDFDAACDYMAEDVVLEILGPPAMPLTGRWQGRAQVREALPRNFGLLENQQPELQTVVAQGDTVIVLARERGCYRATGREYDIHLVQQFQFLAGRIVLIREFCDSLSLVEAAQAPPRHAS